MRKGSVEIMWRSVACISIINTLYVYVRFGPFAVFICSPRHPPLFTSTAARGTMLLLKIKRSAGRERSPRVSTGGGCVPQLYPWAQGGARACS